MRRLDTLALRDLMKSGNIPAIESLIKKGLLPLMDYEIETLGHSIRFLFAKHGMGLPALLDDPFLEIREEALRHASVLQVQDFLKGSYCIDTEDVALALFMVENKIKPEEAILDSESVEVFKQYKSKHPLRDLNFNHNDVRKLPHDVMLDLVNEGLYHEALILSPSVLVRDAIFNHPSFNADLLSANKDSFIYFSDKLKVKSIENGLFFKECISSGSDQVIDALIDSGKLHSFIEDELNNEDIRSLDEKILSFILDHEIERFYKPILLLGNEVLSDRIMETELSDGFIDDLELDDAEFLMLAPCVQGLLAENGLFQDPILESQREDLCEKLVLSGKFRPDCALFNPSNTVQESPLIVRVAMAKAGQLLGELILETDHDVLDAVVTCPNVDFEGLNQDILDVVLETTDHAGLAEKIKGLSVENIAEPRMTQ